MPTKSGILSAIASAKSALDASPSADVDLRAVLLADNRRQDVVAHAVQQVSRRLVLARKQLGTDHDRLGTPAVRPIRKRRRHARATPAVALSSRSSSPGQRIGCGRVGGQLRDDQQRAGGAPAPMPSGHQVGRLAAHVVRRGAVPASAKPSRMSQRGDSPARAARTTVTSAIGAKRAAAAPKAAQRSQAAMTLGAIAAWAKAQGAGGGSRCSPCAHARRGSTPRADPCQQRRQQRQRREHRHEHRDRSGERAGPVIARRGRARAGPAAR